MTNINDIKGQKVQVLATDPTDLIPGQIWYNSTSQTFKGAVFQVANPTNGVWLSGGMTIKSGGGAGAGTQNAGLCFSGGGQDFETGNPNDRDYFTEEYNGTSWALSSNMNTGRQEVGSATSGTQSSALGFGGVNLITGIYLDATESYDGSSWTSVSNLNTARTTVGGAGTQTAALSFGGINNSNTTVDATEEYDGTSWISVNNMNSGRKGFADFGLQNSAFAAGGYAYGTIQSQTEEYNGTIWSVGTNINTTREDIAGAGVQSAGLAFGGRNGATKYNSTEEYNGSSWISGQNMLYTLYSLGSAGSVAAGLGFRGKNINNGDSIFTQEYNGNVAGTFVKTLTSS
jgi:hypothetical protein